MISPPTSSYYCIHVRGEAVEFITSTLSPGALADIEEVMLISENFDNDIQATIGMDHTIALLKQQVHTILAEQVTFNPLFIPSSFKDLDAVLDYGDEQTKELKFTGMDGSPFTLKTVSLSEGDQEVLLGLVNCKPFHLPSYGDIIIAQQNERLN